MNAIRLKTEYLKNPIGIDEPLKEQEFAADRQTHAGRLVPLPLFTPSAVLWFSL